MTIAPSAAVGNVASTGRRKQQREHHGGHRDEGVQLAAAAERVADHRPAAAAAHREPLGHAGGHVGRRRARAAPGWRRSGSRCGWRTPARSARCRCSRRSSRPAPGPAGRRGRRGPRPGGRRRAAAGDLPDQLDALLAEREHGRRRPRRPACRSAAPAPAGSDAARRTAATSTPAASSTVGRCSRSSPPRNDAISATTPSPATGTPVTFSSWLTIMSTAMPAM